MSICLHCRRRTELYLCDDCKNELADMLDQMPWLIEQLDTTLTRQDKLTTATVGKSAENPSPINVGAMKLSRTTRTTLLALAEQVATTFHGRTPQFETVATGDLALWIGCKIDRIQRHHTAGQVYATINELVGDGDNTDGGTLVLAINRSDRAYYGPCNNIVGRDRHGRERNCGRDLYAPRDAINVTCPRCDTTVDARKQIERTRSASDLRTVDLLLDTMRNLGENVSRVKLYEWIKAGRLQPRGWYNKDHGIVDHYIRRGDPKVFSLSQARQLRWHEQELKQNA